jgi:hypothetical protein
MVLSQDEVAGRPPAPDHAEGVVRRLLASLELDGYRILRRVGLDSGPVDVVVGPTGVFAVRARSWPGKAWIGGGGRLTNEEGDAHQVVHQVEAASRLLRARLRRGGVRIAGAESVIALVGGHSSMGILRPGDTVVVRAAELVPYIKSRPQTLSSREGAVICAVIAGHPSVAGGVGSAERLAAQP